MSMQFHAQIGTLKLELLRSGPSHNQLLSPLTAYIALCGSDGPVTIRIPLEHRQLLARISRLRYEDGYSDTPPKTKQCHSEIQEIGEIIGDIFSQVPSLLSELGVASTRSNTMVHLRLVLTGSELGMLPFEAAISMEGFPGSGSPLFLQHHIPISMTREVRRERKLNMQWDRTPKILFAFAAPEGLFVPAQEHLQAIREAIEPWVKICSAEEKEARKEAVKRILTVLPDASLDKIRKCCELDEYTHIHILAHGAQDHKDCDERFGIALCNDACPEKMEIIDGRRLGRCLTARDSFGVARFYPTVVSLSTCDSGNINSVITPGGSIAHELHESGIPWVIASQFPLWMKASAIATDVLYRGLLHGDDPRWVLYKVRQRLHLDSPGTHDWASIVAYSTLPENFEDQVRSFRNRQIRQRFEVKLNRIDELINTDSTKEGDQNYQEENESCDIQLKVIENNELDKLSKELQNIYLRWKDEIDHSNSPDKAENLALCAMVHIRAGVVYQRLIEILEKCDPTNKERIAQYQSEMLKTHKACCDLYSESLDVDPYNDSVITQYLLANTISNLARDKKYSFSDFPLLNDKWTVARQIAEWKSAKCESIHKIKNLGVLAELSLLGAIYHDNSKKLKDDLVSCCQKITQLSKTDNNELLVIKKQFERYQHYWKRDEWAELVEIALENLNV
ncbi:MAG TPA: CHAT domain-containing protein [Nitrosomonas sp.]|nr:CHAT domain-containing protein [Nitrosomonas sp.]HQX12765.1 CHAT domain-containing protein [Nitrosomonas sp.]HRB32881.1 CHAT domain-containing protein [Nitrosomonas sp.]HRB45375.1 CHAT domain-containing protein [Nitrosomonas sp.]HRB78371.1 CHAT domain-containing protein [Nitrosomonas sp.]